MTSRAQKIYQELISTIATKITPLGRQEYIDLLEEVVGHCEGMIEAGKEELEEEEEEGGD